MVRPVNGSSVFALLLLVLVLGTLAVGTTRPRAQRPRWLLVGDSFAVGLSGPLRAELARRVELVTLAREGETLEGYRRAHPELIPPGDWQTVLVSFGVNDYAAGEDSLAREGFRYNATQLLLKAQEERHVRVVWLLPPSMPALPRARQWVTNETGAAIFEALATTARRLEAPELELGADRIHPTGRAYQTWARSLAERFSRL